MTLCLYKCLKAVGLQHHYARFTSMGVSDAAHLSGLIMEDYAKLGIHTMKDRTQLFHLVKMVKNDLESYVFDEDDDSADKGYSVYERSFTYEAYEDDDCNNVAINKQKAVPVPSDICRQLDFNFETTDPKLCGSEGNSPCKTHFQSHPPDKHKEGNSMVDFMGGISTHKSDTSVLPQSFSIHKPKPRPAIVKPKRFNNQRVEHLDRKEISRKQKQKLCKENESNEACGHINKATLVYESKRTAGYNYGLPNSSSPSVNKRRSGDLRISVCVRKRPLTHAESRRGETDVVTTLGRECVIVNESKEAVDGKQYILQHKYYFDHVFGEEILNEEVYQRTVYPLVQHMLSGGKATCFAYGQTGAGKTHTMLGLSPSTPGLYALAVRDIFAHLTSTLTNSPLLVYVSFFEIYCGQLYDLLDHRKRLFSREDGQKVVHIAGLHYVRVDSVSSLLEVILQGTEERSQGMSGVNPVSSRSHALLQIELRGSNQEAAGRMWFVDLAGSERASDAKEPDRQSRIEGAEINQSLLALKECIRSLDQEQSHTPFRQSKLTQVLKDSFVGESMTCMIANISPGYLATEHTLNTLRYADRVKELRGQGGQKGERKSKISSSPKHNLFSRDGGSVGTRGRSPPKKAKLSRQKEAPGSITPTKSLSVENGIFCSTPKDCKWGQKTSARAKTLHALEHTTPLRGWLGTDDKKEIWERVDTKKDRGRENYQCGITENSGQPTHGQLHWEDAQREENAPEGNLSLSSRKAGETENQQSTLNRGREEKRGLVQQQRQAEISRDAYDEVGWENKTDLGEDKERHLRQYHQQLQRFMPPTPSSVYLHSNFKCPSFSTFLPTSSSPDLSLHSCSSLQKSYRAKIHRGQFPFPSGHNVKNDKGHCNSAGSKEWEGTEPKFGKGRVESDKMSEKTKDKAYVRKEEKRPGEILNNTEEHISYSNASEDMDKDVQNVSGVPADEAWRTEERGQADSCGLVSTHSNNGSNSLFNHTSVDLPQQPALADQPFSPACQHPNTCLSSSKSSNVSFVTKQKRGTSNSLFVPMQNTQQAPQAVPSTIHAKNREYLDPYDGCQPFFNAQSATKSCTTSNPLSACKIPTDPVNKQPENSSYTPFQGHLDIKTNLSVLPQDENYADSLCLMDPLSVSLLQVDQQVATSSFLQGEHCNTSVCRSEREIKEDNREELCVSVLELPKTKTQCTKHSDNVKVINTKRRKDTFITTNEHCGIDGVLDQLKKVSNQGHMEHIHKSLQSKSPTEPNDQEQSPSIRQSRRLGQRSTLEDLDHAQWCVVKAHWEKLEQMEALCHKEGLLLCQLPDITFGEYVHKLEKIMEKEAQCVHSIRAQLQPYVKLRDSNQSKINMFKD